MSCLLSLGGPNRAPNFDPGQIPNCFAITSIGEHQAIGIAQVRGIRSHLRRLEVAMRKKLSPAIGCVLVVLGFLAIILVNSTEAKTSASLSNATILIIRHAEEPSKGEGLSSRGTARAQGYIEYFKNFTIDGKPLKIDYLFSASDSSNSKRPRLTLEPLAQALGISIDSQFKSKDFLKLARKIETLPQGSNVLICWHHSDIPNLIGALGADAEKLIPNGKWPGHVYGWLIQLRYDEKGNLFDSKRIKEHLFQNDKASGENAFANAL
jgi:hypothetical protein